MNEVVMYAYFERVLLKPNGEPYKQPKYTMQKVWGKYPPMINLIGRDKKISMVLMDSIESGSENTESTPEMKLQAKGSFNFTGLKQYYVNGDLSTFAYGNPYDKPKYSQKKKPNPFYPYRTKDGYLFIFHFEEGNNVPIGFELMVIPNVENNIGKYCGKLEHGLYNSFLEEVRKQATDNLLSLI